MRSDHDRRPPDGRATSTELAASAYRESCRALRRQCCLRSRIPGQVLTPRLGERMMRAQAARQRARLPASGVHQARARVLRLPASFCAARAHRSLLRLFVEKRWRRPHAVPRRALRERPRFRNVRNPPEVTKKSGRKKTAQNRSPTVLSAKEPDRRSMLDTHAVNDRAPTADNSRKNSTQLSRTVRDHGSYEKRDARNSLVGG